MGPRALITASLALLGLLAPDGASSQEFFVPAIHSWSCRLNSFFECRGAAAETPTFSSCSAWAGWVNAHFPPAPDDPCPGRIVSESPASTGELGCWIQNSCGALLFFTVRRVTCSDGDVMPDQTSCRVGPGSYLLSKALGTGYCPTYGNPIHPGTGNKTQTETDYVGPGGLRFTRVYNWQLGQVGFPASPKDVRSRLGPSWRDTYNRVVFEAQRGTAALVQRSDGRTYFFRLVGVTWTPDGDIADRLERMTDAGGNTTGWRLTTADADAVEAYDVTGRLVSITNRAGLTQTLEYFSSGASEGHLQAVTDAFGRSLTFTYTPQNRIATMTDPAGHVYHYDYDAEGRLWRVTYPGTSTVTRIYHYAEGHLSSRTEALTGITDENGVRFANFGYSIFGGGPAELSELAGGSNKVTVGYSGSSTTVTHHMSSSVSTSNVHNFQRVVGVPRLTTISGPASSWCGPPSQTYDDDGNRSSQADWNSNRTCYEHDSTRNLEIVRGEGLAGSCPADLSTWTPGGGTVERKISTEWHSFYRLPTRMAEPLRITTYVYGEPTDPNPGNRGSLLSKTEQATSDTTGTQGFSATPVGSPRTWTYTYNQNGQILTADGPRTDLADLTSYTYYPNDDPDLGKRGNLATITNALGHLTRITAYNAHGQPLTIFDPNGLVTMLVYDARQRLTSRTVGAETTSYAYDGVGQLTRVTSPDGSFLDYDYDDAHRLFEVRDNLNNRITYTLDGMGNRTQEQAFGPTGIRATRAREYDALNRFVKDFGGTDPLAQVTQYGYDNEGNRTSIDGPLSGTPNDLTVLAYDPLNRLRQVTDALSGVTRFGYDGLDQLASVTDPRNNATSYIVTGLGNQTQEVSPDRGTTQATFDTAGNLAVRTDTRGKTTTFSYDALNRVTSMTFNDSTPALVFSYDNTSRSPGGRGRLHRARDALGNETTFSWTQEGRPMSRVQHSAAGVSLTARWTYDAAGRPLSLQYPSGKEITWGYDAAGRPHQLSLGPQLILSAITYFPFGGPEAGVWGNGRSRLKMHDLDGRVSIHDLDDGQRTLSYDVASRVEGFFHVTQPALDQTMAHDELDRLTEWSGLGQSRGYDYDANGNRTSLKVSGTSFPYTVAVNSNRLLSTSGPGPARSFTYDEAGNVVSDGTSTFSYDARGRLVRSQRGGQVHSYVLNGLGERVAKSGPTVPSGLNHFFYDEGGRLLGEYGASGMPIQEYVWWGGEPVAVLKGDATYFVDTDHLGTPVRLRDASGEVVWRWDGIPFAENMPGEIPSGGRAFVFNLRLPGQYFDRETGLHYNYFRDYDPQTARYVQPDPLGVSGLLAAEEFADPDELPPVGMRMPLETPAAAAAAEVALVGLGRPGHPTNTRLNVYLYVDGSPVGQTDPFGLQSTGGTIGNVVFTYNVALCVRAIPRVAKFAKECERECPPAGDFKGQIEFIEKYTASGQLDVALIACMCQKAGPKICGDAIAKCTRAVGAKVRPRLD